MKKEKNRYITPLLTVVEFKAERGYGASGEPGLRGTAQQLQMMTESMIYTEVTASDLSSNNRLVAGYLDDGGSSNSSASDWAGSAIGTGSWF